MPIVVLFAALLLVITACGGDSGSSAPAPENDNPSSSVEPLRSSSSAEITSATTVVDSDAKEINDDTPVDGRMVDSLTGNSYKTRTIGIYTWINENISDKNPSVKSTCYAYKESNCTLYGRLYMKKNAEDLCPRDFFIPTVSDWKYLMQEPEASGKSPRRR